MLEEVLTGVIGSHRKTLIWAKWEEGKGQKVQYFINKCIIYNKTIVLLYGKNTICRAGIYQNPAVE